MKNATGDMQRKHLPFRQIYLYLFGGKYMIQFVILYSMSRQLTKYPLLLCPGHDFLSMEKQHCMNALYFVPINPAQSHY